VKFSFSAEQEEFRSNLRRFLADRSPTKEVRRLMETDEGYERNVWRAINAQLGLTAIRIPETYGGQGFGFGEQCIVLEKWDVPCSAPRTSRPQCWPPAPF
jgi:alkylation response protein AidB-like acyl-CoA dehydrogenase